MKLYQKLLMRLHLWLYKRNAHYKPSSLMGMIFQWMTVKAYGAAGKCVFCIQGDSRFMEAMALFEAIVGWYCFAVAGSQTAEGIKYALVIVQILKPKAVIEDWGGNDFLAGRSVDDVVTDKLEIRRQLLTACPVVLSLEICPLGEVSPVNEKIAAFNVYCAKDFGADFVTVNDILAPKGVMLPAYDSGDHIHWSLAAFTEAVIPRMQAALASRGIL